MNKIKKSLKTSSLIRVSLFCLSFLLFHFNIFSQNGEEIFNTNCTACHFANNDRLVGPGLAGVNDRHSREWLVKWVKDSQKMVNAGDKEAVALFDKYQVPMLTFEGVLSEGEIIAVLDFLAGKTGNDVVQVDSTSDAASTDGNVTDNGLDGAKLFKANCSACHSVGANKVVGPGLQGITDKQTKEWIHKWVKNSGEFVASGDADAIAIFEEFNKMPMPPQAVNDEEIDAILAYIQNPTNGKEVKVEEPVSAKNVVEKDNTKLKYLFGIVIVLLIVLIVALHRASVYLKESMAKDAGESYSGPTTLWGSFKLLLKNNKGIVAAIIIVLFFGGLVDLMDDAFQIGVHQDYKPEQPIKFSHKIHAGDDKIDCNYCHSSARHSKTSGIPSLNVCMNCHKFIDGTNGKTFMYDGKEYPMPEEIQKIYKHLDYDADNQVFGDNPTPVKWIKVHNLPDHVFFSHQQHVVVGKQKCQTCHGTVETMDVVKQNAPLTMKWCIQCHQKTAVATTGNGYYEEMHKRMTPEFKDKVMKDGVLTVDEIGGWECAKCHY